MKLVYFRRSPITKVVFLSGVFTLCIYLSWLFYSAFFLLSTKERIASITRLEFDKARLDSRRLIRIYDWMWTGEGWSQAKKHFHVCLSTQGSMDRIHWIPEVVDNWKGPISLAMFLTSESEWVGLNLLVNFFRHCNPFFKDFVSIHVAIPTALSSFDQHEIHPKDVNDFLSGLPQITCHDPGNFTSEVVNRFRSSEKVRKELMTYYPQNHMRNIARQSCGTDWVFATDIDIIPRPDSANILNQFYKSTSAVNCDKCAYVIPTFEVDSSVSYPQSKRTLVGHWESGLARPFHFHVFMEAHNATDYPRWSRTNLDEEPVKVSHMAVSNLMKYYEPFYISSDEIPSFEERFLGYGFTRNSQVKAALAEGWTFKVLSPMFAVHWGLQDMETLINPGNEKALRRAQTMANRKVFDMFIKELELHKKLQHELDKILSSMTTATATSS